ncbi:MAG: DUF3990 domain-containing protein [Prevotellaceae bacterium]|jgi:hypothetical protein|nr:DUF3990 domain-containing protein [Prevotellaceae bacterium]
MRVFHGSDIFIQEVDLLKCKPNKDFGRGFYVTAIKQQAIEMAVRVAKWTGNKPVITEFEFDEFAWEDEDLKTVRFEKYCEEWLDFVVLNRKPVYYIKQIVASIISQLLLEKQINEEKASDLFYTSKTFTQLADETSELYKRSWTEIYEMLKKEIGK